MKAKSAILALVPLLAAACMSMVLRQQLGGIDDWTPTSAPAQRVDAPPAAACASSDPRRQAFFGDLHVHTAHSMDARSRDMLGTPDDAYRFARGEAIGIGPFDAQGRGLRTARLDRPLDFAAVTDHAEWIGEVNLCTQPGSSAYDGESCRRYRGEIGFGFFTPAFLRRRMTGVIEQGGRKADVCGEDWSACRDSLRSAWLRIQEATERWNDTSSACRFTTFHGWEHSNSKNFSKIHRNVIFRNAAVPELPISSLETTEAIDLWDRLDALCTNTDSGCEVVTIPHNPNVSNGRLFQMTWSDEASRDERVRQARVRARIERVVEMMQVKGESECKSGMWNVVGEDELCDFEKVRVGDAAPDDCQDGASWGAMAGGRGCQSRLDFARYALVEGLRQQEALGVNPLRFGMIGSTDTHNATPGDVEEHSYPGCCANKDATLQRRLDPAPRFAGRPEAARNPGGLVGVWAEENSRDAIFDALERRETFATSGPRLAPRFFGGWELPGDLCERDDLVERGYVEGVAMGGLLPESDSASRAPVFVASVARDPGVPAYPGGKLDRLQIVKAWYGADGRFHQQVHDVAGRVAVGRTETPEVDLETCAPRGPGSDALCGVWRDPDFDATRGAVYYARVVENPSCRWHWRQCLALPQDERPETCSDPTLPRTIQERAWTSPIWYDAPSSEAM